MSMVRIYSKGTVSRILTSSPQVEDREITVYYGGWDMNMLRSSSAGKKLMWPQVWSEESEWKAEPGYYKLWLPLSGSLFKNFDEQLSIIKEIDTMWQPAPATVAATVLLLYLMETGHDLLREDWCRCAEVLPGSAHASLGIFRGRIRVYRSNDTDREHHLWASACRKS